MWTDSMRLAVAEHPLATRWILAGPGALIAALLFMAAMPVWLPAGEAGINNIVYPVVLAPLFWAVAFIYACLEENLFRGAAVGGLAIAAQGAIVTFALVIG